MNKIFKNFMIKEKNQVNFIYTDKLHNKKSKIYLTLDIN